MNKLIKTLIFDGQLSLSVLDTTEMVNDAIKIHNLTPVAAAALGRTLTACTFMSSNLKSETDKLSVTIAGNGVGGKITVCGNGELAMRGVVDEPQADLPLKPNGKLDVGGFVGTEGRLTVVRSMGLKDPYSGSSALVSGEIAEDFAAYYAYSEQTPTAMALGVLIEKDGSSSGAGGVVIQAMPGATEENLAKAEEIINGLSDVSKRIKELGAEGLMKEYFGEYGAERPFGAEKPEEYYPEYKCLCSRDYIEGVLRSLGKEELKDIIKKEGAVKVDCQFCRKEYVFTDEDVDKMF